MRFSAIAVAVSLSVVAASVAQDAWATMRKPIAIPAQELEQALQALAKDRDFQVVYRSEVVGARHSEGASGALTTAEALQHVLNGTGLTYRYLDERTVTIVPIAAVAAPPADSSSDSNKRTGDTRTSMTDFQQEPQKKSFWDRFRLAEVDSGKPPRTESVAESEVQAGGKSPSTVAEVVVTAQKRIERLQDVPLPVTAVNADTLIKSNQSRLQDYYNTVPGLSINRNILGDSNLSIRGVTTGGLTNPTVGITVDDVPFGSTTALGSRTGAPDIDPSDLSRIEVLRDPQGTLYGASSIGGLLKFVTVDPSTEAFSGHVQGELNTVNNGDAAAFGLRAAVNVPLADSLAIRASGFTRRDPGYIDDPLHRTRGINQVDVHGGRVSALWKATDNWSVKLSALIQDATADGAPYATPQAGLGDLDQVLLGGTGGYNHKIRSYAATLSGTIGDVRLTSVSGYSTDEYVGTNDLSAFYGDGGAMISNALFGVGGVSEIQHARTDKFTQEVRLSSSLTDRFDWLAGVFYTHENTPIHDYYYAVDVNTLAVTGFLLDDPYPTRYEEYSAFGDLTVHFTNRFDVQLGARESRNRQSYEEVLTGPLAGPTPQINPPEHSKDTSLTYLVTPRFKVNTDLMLYARLASGYRPGGPNPVCTLYNLPCQYSPDKTQNYELGLKGNALAHQLAYEASIYYINWNDIQLQVVDPNSGYTYYSNASRARSQGIELSTQLTLARGLTVSGWIAFNDATLRTALPPSSPTVGQVGDRLPYSSRFSGNLSLEQTFPVSANVAGVIGASASYVGRRNEVFAPTEAARIQLPGYVQSNVHAGVEYGEWSANLFVNNLTDKRGILSAPQIGFTQFASNYIQPRTIGLSVSKSF